MIAVFFKKNKFFIASLFLVFVLGFLFSKISFNDKETVLFEYDGGEITTNDLGLYMLKTNISDKYVNSLFLNSILEIESKKIGVSVSKEDKEKIRKNTFSSYGGEKAFNEYLSFQKIDLNTYFEQKYNDYLLELVMSKTFSYSKDNVKKFFEENKELFIEEKKYDFNEIVVSEINIANDVVNLINTGASFDEVAQKYSERKSSKGFVYKSNLSENYINTLDNLKENDISSVFEDDYGFTILKLNKVSNEKNFDFIKDYNSIENVFLRNLVHNNYNDWLDQMKEKYNLEKK